MDDCACLLEHQSAKDRVKRVQFDRVESVVAWQQISWWRIVVLPMLIGLPGIALLFTGDAAVVGVGAFLILMAGLIAWWYLGVKVTTIRIYRGGAAIDLNGMASRRNLEQLMAKLETNIHRTQQAAEAIALERFEREGVGAVEQALSEEIDVSAESELQPDAGAALLDMSEEYEDVSTSGADLLDEGTDTREPEPPEPRRDLLG